MNILYGLYHPDEGRDPAERQARPHRLAPRGDRQRHRDGSPALHAHPGDVRGREHRARRRAAQRAVSRPRHGAGARARALGAVRARGPAGGPRRLDLRRHAAAGRDPEGALPRRRDPHPRRADGRPDAAGGGGALRDRPLAPVGREVDHLHQPQAERGARDRGSDHDAPLREAGGDRPARRGDAGGPRPHDGRARGRAAGREDRPPSRARPLLEVENLVRRGRAGPRGRARGSRSSSTRGRSSASPEWTETARAS